MSWTIHTKRNVEGLWGPVKLFRPSNNVFYRGKSKAGQGFTHHGIVLWSAWHCCKLLLRNLRIAFFICSSSQPLRNPTNKNIHSELLRNLDWFEWEDERNCWEHQLLLKQDQSIKVCLRGMKAHHYLQEVFISCLLYLLFCPVP